MSGLDIAARPVVRIGRRYGFLVWMDLTLMECMYSPITAQSVQAWNKAQEPTESKCPASAATCLASGVPGGKERQPGIGSDMESAELWDVLGEGEVRHIADYASDHFRQRGRPLRIAVDEATWRFTNLTAEQVQKIREGEPAANPIEKVILWRILRLWRLNIQLLFVWDGLRKPGKQRRARGGGKVDHAIVRMLHRMLDLLGVPYHQAPGEAEAECARLQTLGIVDAVWSDDGDSLMFGCTTLIKQHKVAQKAEKDYIRIYRASVDLERLDLDAKSLVVFALTSGGDYDLTGIRGCGASSAKAISKRRYGLGRALENVMTEGDLPAWRESVKGVLRECRKDVNVPDSFPTWKVFQGYRDPAISTDEHLHNLRGLRAGWEIPIQQSRLRNELRAHYNFTTREYLKHIAPMFLVRKLVTATTAQKQAENLTYEVRIKRTRSAKSGDGGDAPAKSEAKIMYRAALLVDLDLTSQPEEEDWTKFAAKDGTPYDPLDRIECAIPSCFLARGLPAGSYEAPPTTKRGNKKAAQEDTSSRVDEHEAVPAISLPEKRHTRQSPAKASPATQPRLRSKKRKAGESAGEGSEQRAKPAKDGTGKAMASKKRKRESKEPESRTPLPPQTFRMPDNADFIAEVNALLSASSSISQKSISVIDVGDDNEDENRTGLVYSAFQKSSPAQRSKAENANFRSSRQRASSLTLQQFRPDPEPTSRPPMQHKVQSRDTVAGNVATSISVQAASQTMSPLSLTTGLGPSPSSQNLVPGETINRAMLRELRMAALLSRSTADDTAEPEAVAFVRRPGVKIPVIIDLT